jgi:hypothetical protein
MKGKYRRWRITHNYNLVQICPRVCNWWKKDFRERCLCGGVYEDEVWARIIMVSPWISEVTECRQMRLGTVPQVCNPSYWEDIDWKVCCWRLVASKKFSRPHLKQWLSIMSCTFHLSYLRKKNWRITFQAGHGIKRDLVSEITNERADRVTQVVDHLPSKCKTLSSIPPTTGIAKKIAFFQSGQITGQSYQ